MKKEWYVVNTVSGYEYKVQEKLQMRINSMDLHENIFRVIVPEQKEIVYKNGVKKEVVKKMFPGYVLVEMVMSDEAWYIVRKDLLDHLVKVLNQYLYFLKKLIEFLTAWV